MLTGLKFIPRDQLNTDLGSSEKERKRSDGGKKEKSRRTKKSSYKDSSSDEGTEKIKKSSKRSKKWYSSDESMSSESESDSHSDDNKHQSYKKEKKAKENSSKEASHKLKKREKRKKHYASESCSSSESESDERRSRKHRSNRRKEKGRKSVKSGDDLSEESGGSAPHNKKELARKEMGLEWMLKPANNPERMPIQTNDLPEQPQVDEVKKPNPRELNPYFKDDGDGYPEDSVETKAGGSHLPSASVVGDGGASWRLKALKRAQEQAARDGRKLEEVVGERWSSVGELVVSAAARPAPMHAHLQAINDRKRMVAKKHESASDNQVSLDSEEVRGEKREYLRDVSLRRPEMREPKVHDSLSWRKRKGQGISSENAKIISAATSSINKFANDGSFMRDIACHHNKDAAKFSHTNFEVADMELGLVSPEASKPTEETSNVEQTLSANQLAAKAMQLRMKGKPDEADKLLREIEIMKTKQNSGSKSASQGSKGSVNRYAVQELSAHKKNQEEDADRHLAQTIMQNKRFSISGQADDEYDFDGAPSRKRAQKRVGQPEQLTKTSSITRRIMTQQERCQFCFESDSRRNHLDVSLANFTYLMLPPWQPVVQGHCCILPTQHDSSTRTVDNYVWEEIRNFKKCLIKMFAAQEKDVVFLETVMGLAQQRRHCLVECIPLPQEIARQAPLYFKKAIDEAEDEWSQHNAKKLIDTSVKGLRASIPKDFPYFHVEFGLNKGFVHVIDDEKQFKSNLGLNVIRGMLRLEEDMYRHGKYDSVESQKQAVASFKRDWEPFDWTKQLS